MSEILNVLGVKETDNLPNDVLDAGRLLDGMQTIYASMPDGSKKEGFANVIAESVRILLIRLIKVGAISQEAAAKENEQLPQEKRVNMEQVKPMPRPKKPSASKPSTDGGEKSQETKPEEKKKVTIEDIKNVELGDTIFSSNWIPANKVKMFVNEKSEDGISGVVSYNDSGRFREQAWDWKYFEKEISKGVEFEIIKKNKITLGDIKDLKSGDIVKATGNNVPYTLTVKSVTDNEVISDYSDGARAFKDVDYNWTWWRDRLNDGEILEIIKKEEKPSKAIEEKFATPQDVENLQVGDKIENIRANVGYVIDAVLEYDTYITTKYDKNDKSETQDYPLTVDFLKQRIGQGARYIITKSIPKKSSKNKKEKPERVAESDRFKEGDDTTAGIIQEIWKLPENSQQGAYQYKIDGQFINEKLVNPKEKASIEPTKKGRKKKSEDSTDETEQLKKLADRLRNIDF